MADVTGDEVSDSKSSNEALKIRSGRYGMVCAWTKI